MKTFYYITITTSSLIFLGCTPIQTPSYPKQVSQTSPIKTTSRSTPSLGTAIKRTKTPTTLKEPVELVEPPLTTETEEIEKDKALTPQPAEAKSIKEASKVDEYGNPPKNYRDSIRKYLSKKADRGASIKYVFSRPNKAEKKDKSWRGWAVDVDMLKRNGKGKILRNKPYTILFNGSSIVDDLSEGKTSTLRKVVD